MGKYRYAAFSPGQEGFMGPQKQNPVYGTFNHVIRYICKLPTVEIYDTEYSKYATAYHFLWDNVGDADPSNSAQYGISRTHMVELHPCWLLVELA